MRIQHPLEVVVVDYLEFEANVEMTKARDMQDNWGGYDEKRETDLVWTC